MTDVASLVLSITSLVGVVVTALTGLYTLRSDERQRRLKSEKLHIKYREPLLFAAKDLQYRLYNILDMGVLHMDVGGDPISARQLYDYTFFAFGQLFAWIHILRRQAQFVCFSTDKENRKLVAKLDQIQALLSTSKYRSKGSGMLWRGQQLAIGEIMTIKDEADDSQLLCIGYSEFIQSYENQPSFREWFRSLEAGIDKIKITRGRGEPVPDYRMRHLQHLLLDLMVILKPGSLNDKILHPVPCIKGPQCPCEHFCQSHFENNLIPIAK